MVSGFFAITFDLIKNGTSGLSWEFIIGEVNDSGRSGGIGPVLVSTGMILLSCLVFALPLGFGTALWLSEFSAKTRASKFILAGIDLLASVPSVVCGLFGMVFFCHVMKLGFSITSGG